MDDRYTPCRTLAAKGIACTCWFEDAVARHGVPTAVFDLHLLVKDRDAAAEVLISEGWTQAAGRPSDVYGFLSDKECKPCRRLALPAEPEAHTCLYNAADWCFPTEKLGCGQLENSDSDISVFFPSLSGLVNALIDSILDSDHASRMRSHLALMLAYLYSCVADLKKPAFAQQLAYDHQQFHYDTQSTLSFNARFLAHERKIREQLRDGTLEPHHDPWNNDRECLS